MCAEKYFKLKKQKGMSIILVILCDKTRSKLEWGRKLRIVTFVTKWNYYFMVVVMNSFSISIWLYLSIVNEGGKSEVYQVIRTIKTFKYENTRSDFKYCDIILGRMKNNMLQKSYS